MALVGRPWVSIRIRQSGWVRLGGHYTLSGIRSSRIRFEPANWVGPKKGATKTLKVDGFSGSDYAGCVDDKKSTSGYIFMMTGGAVS